MVNSIKKSLMVIILGILAFSLLGCQTVKGLGKDITSAAEATEEAIEK
jgi:predicted small secreted protein